MRTIKFRGRCKKSGDLVYGDFIHGVGWKNGCFSILPIKENLAYVKHCDPLDGVMIDPETIGQFTGLHDKNGKEIYEGDVVKCHYFYEALSENLGVYEAENEIVGKICFQQMGLWIQTDSEADSGYLLWINGLHEESFEVIGNIHENPELLN